MPLDGSTVTTPERITLPLYMVTCAAFGIIYVTDPLDRLGGVHALTFQRSLLPMAAWGALFLILAALIGVARFWLHNRMMVAFALSMCAVTWLIWGALYVVSIIEDPETSLVAPILPWFVAAGCVASIAGLVKRAYN